MCVCVGARTIDSIECRREICSEEMKRALLGEWREMVADESRPDRAELCLSVRSVDSG